MILDYDGVLVESEPLHLEAFIRVAPRFGLALDTQEFWTNDVGLADADIVVRLLAQAGRPATPDAIDEIRAAKNSAFEHLARDGFPLMSGASAFVSAAARRMPLAVCSGARRVEIEHTLRAADLLDKFCGIVAVEDVDRAKPDPEGYLKALELLRRRDPSLRPAHVAVIEDTAHGMTAARAAGMLVFAMRQPYNAAARHIAHRVINGYADLDLNALLQG